MLTNFHKLLSKIISFIGQKVSFFKTMGEKQNLKKHNCFFNPCTQKYKVTLTNFKLSKYLMSIKVNVNPMG